MTKVNYLTATVHFDEPTDLEEAIQSLGEAVFDETASFEYDEEDEGEEDE